MRENGIDRERGQETVSVTGPKTLDVGCGANKRPGAIGIDVNPRSNADVIHDLGEFPYPFEDNTFERVVSYHVVEHIPDAVGLIEELHRICKPGATIYIVTPHYTNPDWPSDPTHINHFNSYSFNMFIQEKRVFEFYTEVNLELVSLQVTLLKLWKYLGLEFIVNLDQKNRAFRFTRKFWEQYLNAFVRGKELRFEFRVIK